MNYLLSPRAAQLRVRISAVLVAVAVVVFVASPGLWVTGPCLALVVAWLGVTVAASISAPKAGALAEDARTGRRHAVKYGLPVDPWSQLEAFWSVAGDIPIVVEPIAALTATEPDPFMDEFRDALLTPLTDDVPEDEPFDLDAFVERTRRKYGPPEQRTHHDRLAIEAEVDAYAARVVERREAQRRQRDEVRIVNGAGDTLAVHPDPGSQVRCTWALQGTAEDRHAIRALRAAGVQVAVEDNAAGRVAHLVGPQSAINEAHATYMQGLRERTATWKAPWTTTSDEVDNR